MIELMSPVFKGEKVTTQNYQTQEPKLILVSFHPS